MPFGGGLVTLEVLGVVFRNRHYLELFPRFLCDLMLLTSALVFQVRRGIYKRSRVCSVFLFVFKIGWGILMVALDALFPRRGVVQVWLEFVQVPSRSLVCIARPNLFELIETFMTLVHPTR